MLKIKIPQKCFAQTKKKSDDVKKEGGEVKETKRKEKKFVEKFI